jgi:hypothetical protein
VAKLATKCKKGKNDFIFSVANTIYQEAPTWGKVWTDFTQRKQRFDSSQLFKGDQKNLKML